MKKTMIDPYDSATTTIEGFVFCDCGLPLGHATKCLSIRMSQFRERVGKRSGYSKNEEFGGPNHRR